MLKLYQGKILPTRFVGEPSHHVCEFVCPPQTKTALISCSFEYDFILPNGETTMLHY